MGTYYPAAVRKCDAFSILGAVRNRSSLPDSSNTQAKQGDDLEFARIN